MVRFLKLLLAIFMLFMALMTDQNESVLYAQHEDGDEFLIPTKSKKVDLDVEKAWKLLGGDIKTAHV